VPVGRRAPCVDRNQSTSICNARFNLKLCRQATHIGFPRNCLPVCALRSGKATAFLARSLRHLLANEACVIESVSQQVQGDKMTLSLRCLLIGHDDRIARSSARLWLQCDHCGRETAGWQLARETWPAADHLRSGSKAKLGTASRRISSWRPRMTRASPFDRVIADDRA
jgi:hypothetical protein